MWRRAWPTSRWLVTCWLTSPPSTGSQVCGARSIGSPSRGTSSQRRPADVPAALTRERRRTSVGRQIDIASIEAELHSVAGRILDARKDEYDEWLYRYCGE